MKKIYISLGILMSVLITSFLIYIYLYLPSSSCVQVLVSATNRITGEVKTFGSSCVVPFWYKDVLGYHQELSRVEPAISLSAPVSIFASGGEVDLLFLSRVCEKTYTVSRSYDKLDWQTIGTTTFFSYQEPSDPNFRECEKDFLDTGIASGTVKLFYKYGLLGEKGEVLKWSDVGEVVMEEY